MGYLFGCDDIPAYINDCCPTNEAGRIRGMAFIRQDFTFADGDLSDSAQWEAGIAAGQIIVIPSVTGSMAPPSPNEGPGYGNQETKINSLSFEIQWRDENYLENCDLWNKLRRSRNFYPAYATNTKVHLADKIGTINVVPNITESTLDIIEWMGSAKWTSINVPCPYDIPAGIFECDFQ